MRPHDTKAHAILLRPDSCSPAGSCRSRASAEARRLLFLIDTAGRALRPVVSTFIGPTAYLSSPSGNFSGENDSTPTFTCFSHQKMKI